MKKQRENKKLEKVNMLTKNINLSAELVIVDDFKQYTKVEIKADCPISVKDLIVVSVAGIREYIRRYKPIDDAKIETFEMDIINYFQACLMDTVESTEKEQNEGRF